MRQRKPTSHKRAIRGHKNLRYMRILAKHPIASVGMLAVLSAALLLLFAHKHEPNPQDVLRHYRDDTAYGSLKISYPMDQTLFPPDIAPPTFRWEDENSGVRTWLIAVSFQNEKNGISLLTTEPLWTPEPEQWAAMKNQSLEKDANVTIIGTGGLITQGILSVGRITFKTSSDPVAAPLFYREVNLPFVEAVKDPSRIRWRFGPVSSQQQPPVVLENLPVCGNCHSFSTGGETLAMDVDYANSKGSYITTHVAEQMVLATSDIITWDDYKKEDGEQTFGLLSQISSDGRFIVSTVKDKSVFVPMPPLAFSQLFFPVKGILCIYDRQTRTFFSLPGADDPQYVQSNPTWSPDGKYIVFARAEAYDLKNTRGKGKILLTREECKEFTEDGKPFLFDLYRIAFNDGKGGRPEPLEGASNNGMSNFFAKYSPDGKWIVFCKAKSYMLLQPDSELYIIPAEGGKAERLQANTSRMNSWHSFSPNGKWLVFSSKANSDYTQLYLTHIDEAGHSSPAVLLENFTAPDRAANIPEFVNAEPDTIKKIREEFLNDYSYVRAGNEFFRAGETDNAIQEYKNALELNPNNVEAHLKLGFLLYNVKRNALDGIAHYQKALELDPENPRVNHDLGMALLHQGQLDDAIEHLSQALRLMPNGLDEQYNAVDMYYNLGLALLYKGNIDSAVTCLSRAVQLDPDRADAHYRLAMALAEKGDITLCLEHYTKAVSITPDIDTSAVLHYLLGKNYAQARQFRLAVMEEEQALNLAQKSGDTTLAREIEKWFGLYKQAEDTSTQSNRQ